MREGPENIKIHKYKTLAVLYFFFNSVALPIGLLYTTILTPFFYVGLLVGKRKNVLTTFVLFLLPFVAVHLFLGMDMDYYFRSLLLLFCIYIFTLSFHAFINNYRETGKIYKLIITLNFILVVLALIFYFTPYREYFWYVKNFTVGVKDLPRLALFTYEASYYSTLLIPVSYYYLLKLFLKKSHTGPISVFILAVLPLVLSLSLGVLASTAIALFIFYLLHFRKIFYNKRFFAGFIILAGIGTLTFLVLWAFFPENPIFVRIENVLTGKDSSANGRITFAFSMAVEVAEMKSIWFGSGLGQIKVLAEELLRIRYPQFGIVETVRIPNAVAETLAIFGVFGLILRFGLIFYFFFKTKVWTNYYRTALFLFIFIYQFTGSFITNIAEYVIWACAFSSAFPIFDIKSREE